MDIGDVVAVFDGVETDFVGRAVDDTAFESSASHPDAETVDMMVASIGTLRAGRAAKFRRENHEGVFEKSAPFEILQQRADGLVHGPRVLGVVGL